MYDALIIGGGHNGLVCANYLARGGLRVLVLERRSEVGGAAATVEFHPGFRNSVAAYTVSLLNPKVIRDLRLAEHGLRIVERPYANFLPLNSGSYLKVGPDTASTQAEIARFSGRDAERLPHYLEMIERAADLLREFVLECPPNVGGGVLDLLRAWRAGRFARRVDMEARRDLLDLFARSAGEMLDDRFESDPIKAAFGFDAVVGNYASPYQAGSAYVLLHHCFGEVNGKRGAWGHAIGGMGAITRAMAAEARRLGVEIRCDAPVERVAVEHGRACGVVLMDGSEIPARRVVANVNPRLLFLDLIEPGVLPPEFTARMQRYACGSGSFRVNVALSSLPRFSCLPEPGPHLSSGIIMAPTLGYMDRAHGDARELGISKAPIVEMLIPSTLDDSLAPPGAHVASLFCQQFAPDADWATRKDEAIERILEAVESHAPGFRASIVGLAALSPLDLERDFGLTGGDIFHGRLTLNQLWSARPLLGHADYRAPLRDLYLCGSGTHPGGGVTGAPGHNCARELLRDTGRRLS